MEDARFEAEYLVRTVGRISRAQYFACAALDPRLEPEIDAAIARRSAREPAAYVTGEREFYGLAFAVGPAVLVPRPETELLVEIALAEPSGRDSRVVVDVGTGSGAIAVAVALAPGGASHVVATEISADALVFARLNARRHSSPVRFLRCNLLDAVARADIVLANLPYIPSGEIDALEPEVSRWEPRVALDGGVDGFTVIRQLVADCAHRVRPRLLALEVGFGQAGAVQELCDDAGARTNLVKDLAGIDRIVCARWR